MKWHEDLAWRDDLRHAQFDTVHGPAPGDDTDSVMRFQFQRLRIARVHLQPGVGRHPFKNGNLPSLSACVPVFNGASGIEHKRKLAVRLFRKRLPFNAEEFGFAVISLEFSVSVEARRSDLGSARRER